jgi:superfamily I DNA/RNA helicase
VLDYLRAAVKHDVPALERVYGQPTRFLGRAFLELARQVQWEWHRMRLGNRVMERGIANLRQELTNVAEAAEAGGAEAGLMAALDVTGTDGHVTLKTYLISHYANGDDDAVSPLEEDWDELLAVARARPEVDAFLAHVDEMIQGTKSVNADDAPPNAVVLQTCHRAKGLEYARVYGIGWSQGVLPHARALEADARDQTQDNVDEERRLAYVTMTRAKDVLVLTSPLADSRGRELQPSQFVYEAGLALLASQQSK